MIHPALLAQYRLFRTMEDEDLAVIAQILRVVEVARQEIVFDQFMPHTGPYLVFSGRVKCVVRSPAGKELVLGLYGPGESFEDMTVFLEHHGLRAVAIEDSILYHLPREEFLRILHERPRIALKYFANLSHSFTKLRFGFLNVVLNDAERKLSTYLMSLIGPETRGTSKVTLTLPAKKSVIASHLGMSRETLSRTLRALREAGCIQTRGSRTVVIRNIDLLEKRAARL